MSTGQGTGEKRGPGEAPLLPDSRFPFFSEEVQRGLQAPDDPGELQRRKRPFFSQPRRLLRQAGDMEKAAPHVGIARLHLVQQPIEQGVAHKESRAVGDPGRVADSGLHCAVSGGTRNSPCLIPTLFAHQRECRKQACLLQRASEAVGERTSCIVQVCLFDRKKKQLFSVPSAIAEEIEQRSAGKQLVFGLIQHKEAPILCMEKIASLNSGCCDSPNTERSKKVDRQRLLAQSIAARDLTA